MSHKINQSMMFSLVAAVALAIGCGASGPSRQLVEARETYAQAESGKAASLAPEKLVDARKLLDRAESEDNGSKMEQHYAYLSHRKTMTAMAAAEAEEATRLVEETRGTKEDLLEARAQKSEKKLEAMEDRRAVVERELARVRGELQAKGAVTDAQTEELRRQEAELLQKQKELEEERAARAEAEAKYAAAMKSLEEFAQIKEEQRGLVITLSGQVLFKTNQSTLMPIATQRLDQVAVALQAQEAGRQIIVEGHTDSQGSDAHNQRLSQARADSVRAYLVTRGVDANRVTAVGVGEGRPIADNGSPEGRANNRRVEIIISPMVGVTPAP